MKILDKYKDENEFYSLIGIKWKTFQELVIILKKAEKEREKRGGPKNKLSIEKRLIMTLEYWKEYSSYRVLAKRYGVTHVTCIYNVFWIEKTLSKNTNFKILAKKELLKSKNNDLIAIDATETPVRKIKKK